MFRKVKLGFNYLSKCPRIWNFCLALMLVQVRLPNFLSRSLRKCIHFIYLRKFNLIESEQNHATAIKHAKKSFMQLIDCFNWWTQGNVTAVKMTISTREKDSKRVCRIRGLIGSKK